MATDALILGYGEMGHAMERLLAGRARVTIWQRRPDDPARVVRLEDAAARAEVVILCLPTFPHAEILRRLLPRLRADAILLSVAKGLDARGRPVARIFEDEVGARFGCAVLHGPMIAEEIQAGRHAFAQLGHRGARVEERVLALFAGSPLHLTPSDDMLGINWAVILKNVYAMAFGMADELGLGDNVRGWLAVTALAELDGIVQALGGKPGTPYHLAGLGDLITTATSEHSHHHELGRRLARGETEGIEGEAIRTLARVEADRLFDAARYPLFRFVQGVVNDPANLRARFEALLSGAAADVRR